MYINRSAGSKLSLPYLLSRIGYICNVAAIIRAVKLFLIAIISTTLFVFSPGAVAHAAAWVLGYRNVGVELYVSAFFIALFGLAMGIVIYNFYGKRHLIAHIKKLQRRWHGLSLVLQIQSYDEFQCWLNNDDNLLSLETASARSLLRLLRPPLVYQAGHPIFGSPLFKVSLDEFSINRILNRLLMHLIIAMRKNSIEPSRKT